MPEPEPVEDVSLDDMLVVGLFVGLFVVFSVIFGCSCVVRSGKKGISWS